MNGLDDLLIVLDYLTDTMTLPPGVQEAYDRLRKRQDDHEPFDLQRPVIREP
jgi:hypothetical protein